MWNVIGNLLSVMLLAWMSFCPLKAWAEDVSFEATVNENKIGLQDMIELTLTVHGSKSDLKPITLPLMDGFDARFVGPATRYMIVNGVSSSERSFVYNLFPSKIGHFQIPALEMSVEGKVYHSSPIDIDVVDKVVDSGASADAQEANTQQGIEDKVFMRSSILPKEVYVGEKTPLEMKVFVNGLSMQLAGAPYVAPDGFAADTTANMIRSREVLNGINYDSLRFNTNIYPLRSGVLKVGPFTAQGELIYRAKESNDLFGDFFARTQSRPITLNAAPVSVNVLPLPLEGQPVHFDGAVGQYDFKASVGPLTVKVGDPLTLHMSITGNGRFKNLKFPVLNSPDFKTYDPQVKDDENGITLEQVIIPTSKDITQIPALAFSYFDPREKKYKTITQGPFPVKVIAPAANDEFKAYGFVDKSKSASDKPVIVKFDGINHLIQWVLNRVLSLLKNLFFWIALVVIVMGWLGFYWWGAFQERLQKDEKFARQWKADAKAKELMKNTKMQLEQKSSKGFYGSLYKTLNDYLADKMHLPVASLTWDIIETALKVRSVDGQKLQLMKELMERCDLVRFASATISQEQMSQDFASLEDLMNYLPKIFK